MGCTCTSTRVRQTQGIDYDGTFASFIKSQSYKAIFALAGARDWELEQMDVSTAILYVGAEEDIYVILPLGIEDGIGQICKFERALEGLKQAPPHLVKED